MKNFILAVVLLFSATVSSASQATLGMSIHFSPEKDPQAWCLAQNIYFESRGSNFADQVAVADVVLNRVQDRRYPDTICKVVQQGKYISSWKDPDVLVPARNKCQFSWWCDGKSDYPKDKDAWAQAQLIAYNILYAHQYRGITEGATHYHATYVDPRWAKDMQLIGTIGEHIFYRWTK